MSAIPRVVTCNFNYDRYAFRDRESDNYVFFDRKSIIENITKEPLGILCVQGATPSDYRQVITKLKDCWNSFNQEGSRYPSQPHNKQQLDIYGVHTSTETSSADALSYLYDASQYQFLSMTTGAPVKNLGAQYWEKLQNKNQAQWIDPYRYKWIDLLNSDTHKIVRIAATCLFNGPEGSAGIKYWDEIKTKLTTSKSDLQKQQEKEQAEVYKIDKIVLLTVFNYTHISTLVDQGQLKARVYDDGDKEPPTEKRVAFMMHAYFPATKPIQPQQAVPQIYVVQPEGAKDGIEIGKEVDANQ